MLKILVIDGQGGGIGRAAVERLKQNFGEKAEITAIGTNSAATAAMRKAGADQCATGENAVVYNAARADVIVGAIGIVAANSMMGEFSPAMAAAVAGSDAVKVLIPVNRCNLLVAGATEGTLSAYIDETVRLVGAQIQHKQ